VGLPTLSRYDASVFGGDVVLAETTETDSRDTSTSGRATVIAMMNSRHSWDWPSVWISRSRAVVTVRLQHSGQREMAAQSGDFGVVEEVSSGPAVVGATYPRPRFPRMRSQRRQSRVGVESEWGREVARGWLAITDLPFGVPLDCVTSHDKL
jgi:hypothetical protein